VQLSREQVLAHRVRVQQLDRDIGTVRDTAVLDLGVQDTGPDGALWALALRGLADPPPEDMVLAWTLRGAPHLYRRSDLPSMARAVQPWSDVDAGKRIFDAAKPLTAAGIGILDALDEVAATLRQVVATPTVKGERVGRPERPAARALPALLPALRRRPDPRAALPARRAARRSGARARHLAAGPAAGAQLHDGPRSPRRGTTWCAATCTCSGRPAEGRRPASSTRPWPRCGAGGRRTRGGGGRRQARLGLAEDLPSLTGGGPVLTTRLLGPFDLLLQGRDRSLLVEDPARARALWPVLGRPGAVLVDGELAGSWRPRQSAGRLRVQLDLWRELPDLAALEEQAARLAVHRGVQLAGVDRAAPVGAAHR
jgi:hypothetical protein